MRERLTALVGWPTYMGALGAFNGGTVFRPPAGLYNARERRCDVLIFDGFPDRQAAEKFARAVEARFPGQTKVCDTEAESQQIDPFPGPVFWHFCTCAEPVGRPERAKLITRLDWFPVLELLRSARQVRR